jgi:hypothetical protein
LPLWVSGGIGLAMLLRCLGEARRWPLPSSGFCGILALCLLAGIYLQFRTVLGRDAGTAFMAGLLAIKFFELRAPRDVALIIFSSFFVVISSLLYSQAIELFIYCLIMMWVLTALLLRISMGDLPDNRLLRMLRGSALFFVQALPLAIFLFFFFPRYQGVLQLDMDDTSIGLTSKVEPGSISRLSDDDSIAMTVKFTGGNLPTTDTMYWRALVLWNYQKGAWTPGDFSFAPRDQALALPKAAVHSSTVEQEITIWPHFNNWLFALDYPVTTAETEDGSQGWSEAAYGGVLQLTQGRIIKSKERYTVTSALNLAPQELSAPMRIAALRLPNEKGDQIDPRVRALATELQKGCATEDDYILAVLHYFRKQGFVYTDSPGPGGRDALAVLMRLGNVPARMVVGYYGAQFNPYTSLYIVKQADAHSWDEVWIQSEKKWRRIDPTSVISGSNNMTTASAGRNNDAEDESLSMEVAHHRVTLVSSAYLPNWLRRGMLEVELRRQEVEADWNDWVFSYDPQAQSRLAQFLGLRGEARYVLAGSCILALAVSALVMGFAMRRRESVPPVENFYCKFCRSMAQRGLPRETWEGPLAYTGRVAEVYPDQRRAIEEAGQIVASSRYAPSPTSPSREELKSLLLLITAGPTKSPRAYDRS